MKFRKGEIKFYKGLLPHELDEYAKQHPLNTDYVKAFIDEYEFNYVKNQWKKKVFNR